MYLLPEGFIELTRKYKQERETESHLPRSTKEIWDNIAYDVFFGRIRTDADVNYIDSFFVSKNLLNFEVIKKLSQDEWYTQAKNAIDKEIGFIAGRKQKALNSLNSIDELGLCARCLKEANNFFIKEKITVKSLLKLTETEQSTANFLDKIITSVYGLGYTKTILWLQSFELTPHLCPPSRQILNFVEQDLGEKLTYGKFGKKTVGDEGRYLFFPCIKKIKLVKNQIASEVESATVDDTGQAAWCYKSTQTLVTPFRLGGRLTPKKLLDYLEVGGMSICDLVDRIVDIDEVGVLASELKDFL